MGENGIKAKEGLQASEGSNLSLSVLNLPSENEGI
jgi:hypothetical protein